MTLHIIELLSIVRIRIPRSICSFGRQNKCMQLRAKVNPTRSDPSLRDIYHRDSRSLTVQTNATYPYWTILSENMGLNMSCMSHPLYDLCFQDPQTAVKDSSNVVQEGGTVVQAPHTSAQMFSHGPKTPLKREAFMLESRSSAICKYYFACLCQQRSQPICGKQYDMIYLFCYSEDVVG